jgi:hypothetical protein
VFLTLEDDFLQDVESLVRTENWDTAGGYIASVLLIETTKQLNRRLSIFNTLLIGITIHLSRRLTILSALSVSLACLY